MGDYERGTRPNYINEEKVGEDYTYKKNEVGIIRHHQYSELRKLDPKQLPTSKQFADAYIATLQKKGATVKYIRISSVRRQYRDYSCVQYTMEECIFVADPVVIDDVIVALAILSVLAVTILVVTRPVWLKAGGVSPIEAIGYDIGSMGILIVLAGIAFIILGGSIAWGTKKVKTRGG